MIEQAGLTLRGLELSVVVGLLEREHRLAEKGDWLGEDRRVSGGLDGAFLAGTRAGSRIPYRPP